MTSNPQTTGHRQGYRMDLNHMVKSAGCGIRRPGFNLTVHQSLGPSETLFSSVQMESALFICNITVNLKKKKKKEEKRERERESYNVWQNLEGLPQNRQLNKSYLPSCLPVFHPSPFLYFQLIEVQNIYH